LRRMDSTRFWRCRRTYCGHLTKRCRSRFGLGAPPRPAEHTARPVPASVRLLGRPDALHSRLLVSVTRTALLQRSSVHCSHLLRLRSCPTGVCLHAAAVHLKRCAVPLRSLHKNSDSIERTAPGIADASAARLRDSSCAG
jgi:hypothetical protein